MLIGLFETDAGEILFDGADVTKMEERELYEVRRRVAVATGDLRPAAVAGVQRR